LWVEAPVNCKIDVLESGFMDSLTTLVTTVRKGNHRAFGEIVRRFQDMAWASAFAQIGDAHLAQDAAQEAFVEAYLKLKDLREPEAFPGWFRSIVFKHADRQRRVRRPDLVAPEVFSQFPSQIPDPLTQTVAQEFRASVQDVVAELPEDLRMVTVLFHLDGYSQKEISQFLDVPVSTIKKRLFDGRKQLKERMFRMAKENIQANRPSKDDGFAEKVQFFVAMQENDLKQIEILLKKNIELVRVKTEWTVASYSDYWPLNVTPIFWAAATGNDALVKLLLDNGADVNDTDRSENTPLHNAVLKKQISMVSLLLDRGANLEAQSRLAMTPLHVAALRDNKEMVQFLVEQGANVDTPDKSDRTPADWAALKGLNDTVALLVAKGAKQPIVKKMVQSSNVSKKRSVPSAKNATGRSFNAKGKSTDGLASLTASQSVYRTVDEVRSPILETGIKIVDLMCPLKRGGINGLMTPLSGVGRLLITSQIMTSVDVLHKGYVVYLGEEQEYHSVKGMMIQWRGEMGVGDETLEEKLITAFAPIDASVEAKHELVEMGLTWAEELRTQGHDVLLVLESKVACAEGILPFLKANVVTTPQAAVTVLINGDHTIGSEPDVLVDLDAVITFNFDRAKQGLYPAIDPLVSRSSLLEDHVLAPSHTDLAGQIKRLLNRYVGLHPQYEYNGFDALFYFDDREAAEQHVIRARRLHRFLTQPLPGLEPFTGRLGEHVSVEDTLKGCGEILDGKHDGIAEEAFYMIGTIEQVLEK
jgi:RNA polymerase sigma factor (sigma-70 family)